MKIFLNDNMRSDNRLHPPKYSSSYYSLEKMRSSLELIASRYIDQKKGDLVLLDYGCGTKPYSPIFSNFISHYIGADIPGNTHADIELQSDSKLNLSDDTVDIVLSTQVLEHIDSPKDYIDESYRVLRQNGLLILSTHGYWLYHPDPLDLWRWTSSGLKKIIQEGGFEIIYFEGIMGLAATSIQLFQDASISKVPKPIKPLFAYSSQLLISFIDKLYPPMKRDLDACLYVLVAKNN